MPLGPVRGGIGRLAQLGERYVYTVEVAGSSPASPTDTQSRPVRNKGTLGEIAQLVEQWTENPCVASSILALATNERLQVQNSR